jgi:protein-disulfide isomerase
MEGNYHLSMKRYIPFAIIVSVLVVAVGSGALLFRIKQQHITRARVAAAAHVPSSDPGAQPPHMRGGANAPVTLEEFGDFECRPCGDLSSTLAKIEQDYGIQLRVIFRQFPLAVHRHALEAACASEAAGRQDRFWEMHDLLYHNRFMWPGAADVRGVFSDYAKNART